MASNIIELNSKYKFNIVDKIGEGISSNVYKGIEIATNLLVAIKVLNKTIQIKRNMDLIQNEINITNYIKDNPHESMIKCYDIIKQGMFYYIIFEFATNTLNDIINKIPKSMIFIYFKQLVEGLIYFKKHNIIHNDIKPHNILLVDSKLKFCDFGMACQNDTNHDFICGSPMYMNLEKLNGNNFTNGDFWSIKIIFYQMIFSTHPFVGAKDRQSLVKKINSGITCPLEIKPYTILLKKLINNEIFFPEDLIFEIEKCEEELNMTTDSNIKIDSNINVNINIKLENNLDHIDHIDHIAHINKIDHIDHIDHIDNIDNKFEELTVSDMSEIILKPPSNFNSSYDLLKTTINSFEMIDI